ncbi:MAG: stage III sporulation protein AB [Clostridium butyricum]|nr:stage III sporulation protein AB [Clostridium butyricum]
MLKVALGIIIFIICSYTGFLYGDTFRKRTVFLKEILKGLTILQNDILYGAVPIPEALNNLSVKLMKPLNAFLREVTKKLIDGSVDSVFQGVQIEYNNFKSEFYLYDEDKKILEDFFKSLGESGVYGQEKIFTLAIEGIKINLKDSEEIAKKNVKLYRYLGACIGGMIGIFIL